MLTKASSCMGAIKSAQSKAFERALVAATGGKLEKYHDDRFLHVGDQQHMLYIAYVPRDTFRPPAPTKYAMIVFVYKTTTFWLIQGDDIRAMADEFLAASPL